MTACRECGYSFSGDYCLECGWTPKQSKPVQEQSIRTSPNFNDESDYCIRTPETEALLENFLNKTIPGRGQPKEEINEQELIADAIKNHDSTDEYKTMQLTPEQLKEEQEYFIHNGRNKPGAAA